MRVLGADHAGGQPQAVEDQMRTVAQQPPVLDRSRFALFTIGDDDRVPAESLRAPHRAQLDRHGERRTAAPDQTGLLDVVEERVGIVEGLVALGAAVLGDVLDAGLGSQQARRQAGPRRDPQFGPGVHGSVHDRLLPSSRLRLRACERRWCESVSIRPVELTAEQLTAGMSALAGLAAGADAELIENNLAAMPPSRREVELLMTGTDPGRTSGAKLSTCAPRHSVPIRWPVC